MCLITCVKWLLPVIFNLKVPLSISFSPSSIKKEECKSFFMFLRVKVVAIKKIHILFRKDRVVTVDAGEMRLTMRAEETRRLNWEISWKITIYSLSFLFSFSLQWIKLLIFYTKKKCRENKQTMSGNVNIIVFII